MTVAINTITAICFVLFTLEVVYVAVNTVIKKRPERIAFIRSFKKGKCVAVFLTALPLFLMAYLYAGNDVWQSVFSTITHVVGLVVLKFDFKYISALLSDSLFYKITVYYCGVLVTLNAVLFALSLTGQRLWQWFQLIKNRFTHRDKLYIFGYNENSLSIYKSDKTRSCAIVDKISDGDCTSMYINKISFISCRRPETVINKIFSAVLKKPNKITAVINTGDDERNIETARLFLEKIRQSDDAARSRLFEKLDVHVFGDPAYEAIYGEIVAKSFGCVHYKNKYRMIAMNFIERYPLTKFMDESQIDYSTSLVRAGVDINVCMIGFGRPNRRIFLTSVANNQFICAEGGNVKLKQVNYHVFDKTFAEMNKGLNHSYYRFANECADASAENYLPLPELPAHEKYYHIDINDAAFYNTVRGIVTAGKTDANFIIVSFESDLENIDMAQKLIAKCNEWGAYNLTVFVRVKAAGGYGMFFDDKRVILIGDEAESVYDISEITADCIFKMAQMRNEIYDLEYKLTADRSFVVDEAAILENRRSAAKNWFVVKSQLERESSLYGCLSLRSKLNMMGLDYCRVDENDLPALTEAEYMKIYAAGDMPDTQYYNLDVDGKKVIRYTLDFPESRRKNLAILEHYRWNSFMISQGMIPADKDTILNEKAERGGKLRYTNGKNYALRRHGNLTTFEGLVDFRRMVADRDGVDEADRDVIKYDYQLLDDAYWLLTKTGYKIVRKA